MSLRVHETRRRLLDWTFGAAAAEALAAQVLLFDGYRDLDPHHPFGGPDGRADATARRDGMKWAVAVYFPRGKQSRGSIRKKLLHDWEGVSANGADGLVFVTNQEVKQGDRKDLRDAVPGRLRLYHLERVATALDHPKLHEARERYLGIEASAPLERLSEIAATDAAHVGDDGSGGTVRLDEGLYVFRPAEEAVLGALGPDCGVVAVVGEAGNGKTSLLWQLRRRIRRELQREAWLLKASALRLSEADGGLLSVKELRDGVAAAHADRPVVLIDTVDLRLQTESERDAILEMLAALSGTGASIVLSTRPREAELLDAAIARKVGLGGFESELEEAVRRHVTRYYRADAAPQAEAETGRILDGAVRGLPVRELLHSPLRLRMLFEVYAPAEVPTDIDSFGLYRRYWDRRVAGDHRAGSAPPVDAADLSPDALEIARVMLAEGRPELPQTQLSAGLKRLGVKARVDELVQRGVMLRSEAGDVRFFHQTFFEHAAGRAFASQGPATLERFLEHCAERRHDSFLAPVREQALLYGAEADAATADAAQRDLAASLAEPGVEGWASALFVYVLLPRPDTRLHELVDQLVRRSDIAAAQVYLSHVPNAANPPLDWVVRHLDAIWVSQQWRQQQAVISLLARMAYRAPSTVRGFIDAHPILDVTLVQREGSVGVADDLARAAIRAGTAEATPEGADWAWHYLSAFWREAQAHKVSYEVRAAIARALSDPPVLDEQGRMATRWMAEIPSDSDTSIGLQHACARLWELEWKARGLGAEEALTEIDEATSPLDRSARLIAAASVLSVDSVFDPVAALANRDIETRWLLATLAFPRLLEQEPLTAAGEKLRRAVCVAAAREPAYPPRSTAGRRELDTQLRATLDAAELRPEAVADLLNVPELASEEPWLDAERLGRLLAAAAVGGHTGAGLALTTVIERPHAAGQKLLQHVGRNLAELAVDSPDAARALLALTIAVGDANGLSRAWDDIKTAWPEIAHEHARAALTLATTMSASKVQDQRRLGYRLRRTLVLSGSVEPPGLPWLVRHIRAEKEPRLVMPLLDMLASCATGDVPLAFAAATERIDPDAAWVHAALDAACRIAIAADYPDAEIVELATQPPFDRQRLKEAASALAARSTAPEALLSLMEGARRRGMSQKLERDVGNGIAGALRTAFADASHEDRHRMLLTVADMGEGFGRALADAACRSHFDELRSTLDELLDDSRVDRFVREQIRTAKRKRERLRGNQGWAELYPQVAAEAAGP